MREDLPTFGMPRIMQRAARAFAPCWTSLSVFGFAHFAIACTSSFTPRPFTASTGTAASPCAAKYFTHVRVAASSARSALLSTITRGLSPTISRSTGFAELSGIRASSSSKTTSTSFRFSLTSRSALRMCPGYHCRLGMSITLSLSIIIYSSQTLILLAFIIMRIYGARKS